MDQSPPPPMKLAARRSEMRGSSCDDRESLSPVAPAVPRNPNQASGVAATSSSSGSPVDDTPKMTKFTRSQKPQVEFPGKNPVVRAPWSAALP